MISINEVPLSVDASIADILKVIAARRHPAEACGVILRNGGVVEYPNVAPGSKRHNFDFSIDLEEVDVLAMWHSHPRGPEEPSADDLPCMEVALECQLNIGWIIVTPDSIKEYKPTRETSLQRGSQESGIVTSTVY